MTRIHRADELKALLASGTVTKPCNCGLGACAGWESMTEDRWPAAHLQLIATLRDPDEIEPSYEEHHPEGTRYDSANVPVALRFFPYNRCDVWHCSKCERQLLRYTEFGGYYVDHRVRELSARLALID